MNLLTMEHVTKAYTDRVLLDDVASGINENEKSESSESMVMGKSITFENDGLVWRIRFRKAQYGKYGKDMLSATDTGVWRGRDGTSGSSAWNHQ